VKHIEKLIFELSVRRTRLIHVREKMRYINIRSLTVKKRQLFARHYENLTARIDEIEKTIDALINALNADREELHRYTRFANNRANNTG
jgi:primosomal protein N''